MISFIFDPPKDLVHIIDRRDREDDKKYKLSEIALICLEYYDDTEADGYICIYLKPEISKVYKELLFTGFDQDHRESILEVCFSYNNQIDISGNSEWEFDIHEIFITLIRLCEKYKIEVVSPNNDYSLAGRYFEWLKQKEVELWWEDDFIFRNYFSRN
ncbi:MAG: hypothetical protein IM584_04655 [Chitinophagaceae bacterium]|jgi:hypothetical protein|nr:hypothetical protein [Chitinophagaceae bacterium]MCA6455406.1 hypothetical protein [Chitinophagaceae bacterium]MCA6459042.1 hypothetical protein [Chitinophagaceae bacterium]MCA6465572.1 hypothetical protein [Chitinophagaceae bacterium]